MLTSCTNKESKEDKISPTTTNQPWPIVMIIAFIGPPGSGKGTQSRLIAQNLNISYVATGDLLRKAATTEAALAKILDSGMLADPNYVNNLVSCKLRDIGNGNDCILDGYPRNMPQALYLRQYLEQNQSKLLVMYFQIADELIIKRLSGRRSCPKCGAIYNIFYANSKIEWVCDACKDVKLSVRNDDNALVVQQRLQEYKNNTQTLIDFYTESNIITVIDASKSVGEIYDDCCNIIAAAHSL